MLEVEFIEIFIRAMPEQVLLVIGSYIVKNKIKLEKDSNIGVCNGGSLICF